MANTKSRTFATISSDSVMSPHLVKGNTPPFYEMDEYKFQDMCTDLFSEEPSISHARVFGERGQRQYGIDIIAEKEKDEKEVGQCKKYKTFPPQKIIEASDEFLEHWDTYWKDKKVTRFILFVASDITRTQSQEEIERQRTRFTNLGITYEVWDARSIERKLRPHSAIVSKYCHPLAYWVKEICGIGVSNFDSIVPPSQSSVVVDTLLFDQLGEFASKIAGAELQNIRELWQQGREEEAVSKLNDLQEDHNIWNSASAELKARILCFQANIALEIGSPDKIIEDLLNEANLLASTPNERRVRALLLRRRGKLEEAFSLLMDIDDIDTHNLRAALLLESGNQPEAFSLLQNIVSQGLATAETYRVLALCQLVAGALLDANTSIEHAKSLHPSWIRLEIIEAIIVYYSSLSPLAFPPRLEAFPLPIEWVFVNQDAESIVSLRKAEQIFRQVIENRQRVVKDAYVAGWRLASLLNDAERQDEALTFCKALLGENPTYLPAIIWGTSRHLDIDFTPSVTALNDRIAKGDYSLDDALALVTLYVDEEHFGDGLQLIKNSRELFVASHAEPLWIMWYAQMLLRLGDSEELTKLESELPPDEVYEPLREFFAYSKADLTGQWDDFVTHNLKRFDDSHDPDYLFNACMVLYHNGNWTTFSDHAESLVEFVKTADVYRYAIIGTYNAHRYEQCSKFITQWKEHFVALKHQHEFDQISVACLDHLGDYPQAVVEAVASVEFNPSVTNTVNLISLLYDLGDYNGVSKYSERLLEADLQSNLSLQLAQFLQGENNALGQKFWKKAVAQGLSDEYIGPALGLAFQLGLDNETGPLYPKLLSYNSQSPSSIQPIRTKSGFLKVVEDLRRRSAEVEKVYRSGVLPVHFYAQELNLTLSDLFHDELQIKQSAEEILRSRPLYIRYGGRHALDGFPEPIPNLHLYLDISALLLAAHLNILKEIERAFTPLFIPAEVFSSLAYMVSRTFHHQPSVIEANKTVVRFVNQGKLKVLPANELVPVQNVDRDIAPLNPDWISRFEVAKRRNGYFLTHLPPTRLGTRQLTVAVHPLIRNLKYLLNCKTVAHSLRDKGEISKATYQAALQTMGSMATNYRNVPSPGRGAFILCDESVIHTLVDAELLEPMCRLFDVYITQQNLEIAHGSMNYDSDRQESRAWLHGLQERLRAGIQDGRYKILPPQDNDDREIAGTTSNTMLSLIKYADHLHENDAVWIDDRFCSHFGSVGKAQTIGVTEILKFLVGKGTISKERYFEYLSELRTGNMRYIPLESDELLFNLQDALRQDGETVYIESIRSLIVLAKYIASCIAQREDLQIPPVPEQITNPSGEIEFFLGLNRAIQHTLAKIWTSVPDENARRVMAEWIIENLYLDYPSLFLRSRNNLAANEPDYYRAGAQFASFLSIAYFDPQDTKEHDSFPDYVEWLLARVFGRRLQTEPMFLDAASRVIRQTLIQTKASNLASLPEPLLNKVMQQYIAALPEVLRTQIESDSEFLGQVGITLAPIITVDDLEFPQNEFWECVASAVNGKKSASKPINIDALVRFYRHDDKSQLLVCFEHPQEDRTICLNQPELHLLSADVDEQREFLQASRFSFDYDEDRFQLMVAELTSMAEPLQRILRLHSLWSESAAIFYRNLSQEFQPGQRINLSDVVKIDFGSIARFIRLNIHEMDTTNTLLVSAESLISDLGVEIALQRLSGIPSPLPNKLLEAIQDLPVPERVELIRRIGQQRRSVISRFHLLHLLIRFRHDDESFEGAAQKISQAMLSEEGKKEIEAFSAVLMWVHQRFILRTDFAPLSTNAKATLEWTHTEQIFTFFSAHGIDYQWIYKIFTNDTSQISTEYLVQDSEYWNDITHPRFAQYKRLIVGGLLYAFNSDYSFPTQEIVSSLVELTFPIRASGARFPDPYVLLNIEFLSDICTSFFCRNIAEELKSFVDATERETLPTFQFLPIIDDAIAQISSNETDNQKMLSAWAILVFSLGDVKVPKALSSRLALILEAVDWVTMFITNRPMWNLAFSVAVAQYHEIESSKLQEELRGALIKIAEVCSTIEASGSATEVASLEYLPSLLLDGALKIALNPGTQEISLDTFGQSCIGLAVRWKRIHSLSLTVIRIMCEDLPLAYAQQLWSCLTTLRAL